MVMEGHDEGFGRNLNRLFGQGTLYRDLAGRKLAGVILSDDKGRLTFEFTDGKAVFGVEGDCCSESWIEHLTVPNDVEGHELVDVSDERISQEEVGFDLLQVYSTRFRTDKGETITVEYRNTSNGYYGGYLVRLDDEGVSA